MMRRGFHLTPGIAKRPPNLNKWSTRSRVTSHECLGKTELRLSMRSQPGGALNLQDRPARRMGSIGGRATSKVSVRCFSREEPYAHTMLLVRTDLLQDVPVDDREFVREVALSSPDLSSSYGLVYRPAELRTKRDSKEGRKLWSATTAYLDEENVSWLPQFVAQASLLQPLNAHHRSECLPQIFGGGVLDTSSREGSQPGIDHELIQAIGSYFASGSSEPSRWAKTDEFRSTAETWAPSFGWFDVGDGQGLTLEAPFGARTGLIRLRTDAPHPFLGNGLLCMLLLPYAKPLGALAADCAILNLLEAEGWTSRSDVRMLAPSSLARRAAARVHFLPSECALQTGNYNERSALAVLAGCLDPSQLLLGVTEQADP
jgi:hypothetical protein